jgi:glycosyltransferase involved in cell wall biosynthesis
VGSPLISVLMPVFNCQAHLAKAIQCIGAQTLEDWELIIVDDGSTDDSPAIMEKLGRNDVRLRTFRQENGGVGAALNTALGLARGKYLARMDADDRTPPERFAEQIRFLEREPDITVVGGWHRFVGEDEVAGEGQVYEFPTEPARLKATMVFRNPISHPTVMMRHQAFRQNGWRYNTRRRFPEDYDLWITIAQRHALANIPKVYLDYRRWSGSVSHDPRLRWREEIVEIQCRLLACMGLVPEDVQRVIHTALAFDEIPAEAAFIAAGHAWLLEIQQCNARQRAVDALALERVLTGRYIALVRAAARCGVKIDGLAESPFRQYVTVPLP